MRREVPVDRRQAKAAALAGEMGLDELGDIAADQCDAVAEDEACRAEMRKQAVGVAVEFGEAAIAARRKERGAVAVAIRPMAEEHPFCSEGGQIIVRTIRRIEGRGGTVVHRRLV